MEHISCAMMCISCGQTPSTPSGVFRPALDIPAAQADLRIGSAKGGSVNMQHQGVSLHLKQPVPLPICIADGQREATQWSRGFQTSMSKEYLL